MLNSFARRLFGLASTLLLVSGNGVSQERPPPASAWPVDIDGDGVSTVVDRTAFQLWVTGGGDETGALESAEVILGPDGAVLDVSSTFDRARAPARAASEMAEEPMDPRVLGQIDTKLTILDAGAVADYPAILGIRLWRGRTEPPAGGSLAWATLEYDDSTWEQVSQTPIGYPGQPFLLSDMQNNYTTFYVRIEFRLSDLQGFEAARDLWSSFEIDLGVDDGFVAYLNDSAVGGMEIRRLNTPQGTSFNDGAPIPRTATALRANAVTARVSGYTDLFAANGVEPSIDPDEVHVLAIQVLNAAITDADCVFAPRIHVRKRGPFLARSTVNTVQDATDDHVPTSYEVAFRARPGIEAGAIRVDHFLDGDPGTLRSTIAQDVTVDVESGNPFSDESMYRVLLQDLPPGATVTYRLFVNGVRFEDDDLSFQTPYGFYQSFPFIVVGNSGWLSPAQTSLATVIASQNPAFCLAAGDQVIRNNRYELLPAPGRRILDHVEPALSNQAIDHRFYGAYADAMAKAPFYVAPGNEDLETLTGAPLVTDYELAYTQPVDAAGATERYYSFDHGPVHVVVLSSGLENRPDLLDYDVGFSLGPAQLAFLQDDLAATRNFWKIVVFHHPVYTSSAIDIDAKNGPDDEWLRATIETQFGGFEEFGVDVVISGHHTFFEETHAVRTEGGVVEVMQQGPHFVFDSPEDQAPVYLVTGGAGETLWETTPTLQSFTMRLVKQAHVTRITVDQNRLTIQPLNTSGGPIDIDLTGPGTSSTITKNIFPPFIRADSNGDGVVSLSDAVFTDNCLFLGGPGEILCEDAADADDNGDLEITDVIYTLNHLFFGGPEPPSPYPGVGPDPTTDELMCLKY